MALALQRLDRSGFSPPKAVKALARFSPPKACSFWLLSSRESVEARSKRVIMKATALYGLKPSLRLFTG
jgi:hypothetical protein